MSKEEIQDLPPKSYSVVVSETVKDVLMPVFVYMSERATKGKHTPNLNLALERLGNVMTSLQKSAREDEF
jgi:hypothetical protein